MTPATPRRRPETCDRQAARSGSGHCGSMAAPAWAHPPRYQTRKHHPHAGGLGEAGRPAGLAQASETRRGRWRRQGWRWARRRYMSPEQIGEARRPGHFRADLYNLGATLFALVTGRVPMAASPSPDHAPTRALRDPLPAWSRSTTRSPAVWDKGIVRELISLGRGGDSMPRSGRPGLDLTQVLKTLVR